MNGRKVLLIVDNCPTHPKVIESLRNIELFFLPPNSTNAIDIEHILNFPSENESLMESPTDEEIIQGVMDVSTDDEQDPDNSSLYHMFLQKRLF
ncbi:hypothetical protein Godav_014092 [Gossypium davidsonii]|uniref:DDE-1 domain-containing protein n=3 Tax=Gossypium TaxID=3633 RepID=A0A7J8RK24_GOSDV|nr:hypothetical protein [Gossypium davidsonii]